MKENIVYVIQEIPGTKTGNWGWRLKEMDQLNSSIKNLKLLNEMNSRNI